jgi:glycosyltransferase involved in cell wall biosynthesis
MPTSNGSGSIPRIAVVVSQLGAGGAERQTVELLRGLRDSPWRPQLVVCLSRDLHPFQEDIRGFGYTIEVLPRAGSYDPGRLRRLRGLLRRHRIGIVHAVHLLASGYAFLATRGPGMPAVLPTIRGTVIDPGPLRGLIYRWMFHSCPRALANSHRGAAFVERRFAVPPGRIAVVPNGIDFTAAREASALQGLRAALAIPAHAPLVVYVGKNSTVKNVPRFMATWKQVSAAWPDAHAVLIGGGLGVQDRPALLGDCPPHRTHCLGLRDDVPSLLSQADVLVLTSNSEGAPNVVLEALAVGTPVVSTDVGDVPRMVLHESTGFVVPSARPEELAAAVGRVLAGRREFRGAVLEDAARLEREYSVEAMIANTVTLWQEIAR